MAESTTLRRVVDRLLNGSMRIPGFQRGYVWEPWRAALLMDSLWKGYPVGSVLLWRTTTELKTERRLGDFEIPFVARDAPVDYVLDGQQRLTAIFTTFQTALKPIDEGSSGWLPIYYDFYPDLDNQDPRFIALDPDDAEPGKHFPLNTFFDAVGFSEQAEPLDTDRKLEIVRVQERFKESLVSVETFESEDRASVAIVFERVNRLGVDLDVFQLLTAWTWSDDFDLQERFEELIEDLSFFGLSDTGDSADLLLRCCAAHLGLNPSPSALVEISGDRVRDSFEVVAEAVKRTVEFLRTNFSVYQLKSLPHEQMLIPLCVFFATDPERTVTGNQRRVLRRWFWRAAFTRRFAGNAHKSLRRDIAAARELRRRNDVELADIACEIDYRYFHDNSFSRSNVATRTFALLLANSRPLGFLSGEKLDREELLTESGTTIFHHVYPKPYLKSLGEPTRSINRLANYAIISRSESRRIAKRSPSGYRAWMPTNTEAVLAAALLPDSLFDDDYDEFIYQRGAMLAERAQQLID